MQNDLAAFDVPAFLQELRRTGCALGEPFHYFSSTTSTNDEAKRLAISGAPHGTTCFAEFQTEGRGRHGKHWQAEAKSQILTSIVLRGVNLQQATLTLAVGVALHRALEPLLPAQSLRIKWPNDLEVDGRKLAGILTESHVTSGGAAMIVGVGLNVWEPYSNDTLPLHATALRKLGCAMDRERLMVRLLAELATAVEDFARAGLAPFLPYLNRYDALQGAVVQVDAFEGRALGVAPNGALRVQTATGEVLVASGTVTRLGPPP